MSLLSANISILCDLTCYVCDLSEERGSSAEWDCCTWGYFSPSLKSRTISQNSTWWGSHARVGAASVPGRLQCRFLCRTETWGPTRLSSLLPCWGSALLLVAPRSAHCHSSSSCLKPQGQRGGFCRLLQNITHHRREAGGGVGPCTWWRTEMWDLFPALPQTSPFHFWSKPLKLPLPCPAPM